MQVYLTWTPSASPGVEVQRVRIFDVETQEVYGEADLGPAVAQFGAECPQGATVQGAVVTVRGDETAPALSNQITVPYAPLEGATGLVLEIPQ